MECNKEEAVRAKEIAEKKMQIKDFAGAQRFALKAQRLYPGLENISQMLTVCEVHVSSELNLVGSEMDWYGILQVPDTADELLIKKQYRKLALVLHPDKNRFPGAEAAFKLVGEANRVLSDHAKRSLYNIKRINIRTQRLHPQPNKTSYTRKQPNIRNNFTNHSTSQFAGMKQTHQQQKQTAPTFWTACPQCNTRHQHYRTVLNRHILCQQCSKPFVATEMIVPGDPSGADYGHAGNQSTTTKHNGIPNKGNVSRGAPSTEPLKRGTDTMFVSRSKNKAKEDGGEARKGSKFKRKSAEVNRTEQKRKPSDNLSQKRHRKMFEGSSTSCDDDGIDVEGVAAKADNVASQNAKTLRKSTRAKQNVSYNENGASDDFVNFTCSKRLKGGVSSRVTDDQNNGTFSPDGKEEEERDKSHGETEDKKNDGSETIKVKENSKDGDLSEKTKSDDTFAYPEPEFHDFDKYRGKEFMKVDQIWAVYDDVDGMPRFYVRIRKVYSHDLKLRITWLEAHPQDEDGLHWLEGELPIACGNFRIGKSEDTEDVFMFSHLASWEKGETRCTYKIYPRKGEVWALFKDWSAQWSSKPDMHRKYEFDFVEILSDYAEGAGVVVVCLVMLEGFTSLFRQGVNAEFKIPPNELLRFSHRVPSYGMTRQEKEGVPAESFELDPASVYFEGFSPSKGVDKVLDKDVDGQSDTSWCKSSTKKKMPATGTEKFKMDKMSPNENNNKRLDNRNFQSIPGEEISATGTEKFKMDKMRPNENNNERLDNRNFQSTPGEEISATELEKLDESESTFPDEKNTQNKVNFYSRKHSPRKMIGAHGKSTCTDENIQSKDNFDNRCFPGKTNEAHGKNASPDEKNIQNEYNLENRRRSSMKLTGDQDKPHYTNASDNDLVEVKPIHGGLYCRDSLTDDKPGEVNLTSSVAEREPKSTGAVETQSDTSKGYGSTSFESTREYPDPLFHQFESEKSVALERGQIWAVYSDENDGLPKFYARIKKVELPEVKVHINWLEACPRSEKEVWWSKKELPVGCGIFKLLSGDTEIFHTSSVFSHQVTAGLSFKKNYYSIFPKNKEVWALYKNWTSEWNHTDLKQCEYEVVEIIDDGPPIKVNVLEVVRGYKTIYRRAGIEIDITRDELLRFSHCIPSFILTDQRGELKECLELDPGAIPPSFFQSVQGTS